MDDTPIEVRRGELAITTDRSRIDLDAALMLLRATHWGTGMSRDTLTRAIANSICFGVYRANELIGLGRVVTDLATYAYWTDVVIAQPHRGRGIGRWLSDCMLGHPELQNLRRVALLTRDAADLYSQLGFSEGPGRLIYMERKPSGNAE
jgi:GNAT superfamily N-acetyltransferase